MRGREREGEKGVVRRQVDGGRTEVLEAVLSSPLCISIKSLFHS